MPVAFAQNPSVLCDAGLQPAGGNDVAYSKRGDRCEGLYVQEVAGGALELVSFTAAFLNYPFTPESALFLRWPQNSGVPVHLRSCALKRRVYYRMDTVRAADSAYLWPADLLSRLGLSRDEIGILAWTARSIGGSPRQVYLPLLTEPRSTTASFSSAEPNNLGLTNAYQLAVISSVELQEVYVTLRPLDSLGRPGTPVRSQQPLGKGFYPADRPIVFRVRFAELTNAASGLFSLSIGAELKNGEPRVAAPIWFLHEPAAQKSQAGKEVQ